MGSTWGWIPMTVMDRMTSLWEYYSISNKPKGCHSHYLKKMHCSTVTAEIVDPTGSLFSGYNVDDFLNSTPGLDISHCPMAGASKTISPASGFEHFLLYSVSADWKHVKFFKSGLSKILHTSSPVLIIVRLRSGMSLSWVNNGICGLPFEITTLYVISCYNETQLYCLLPVALWCHNLVNVGSGNFRAIAQANVLYKEFENLTFKITATYPIFLKWVLVINLKLQPHPPGANESTK